MRRNWTSQIVTVLFLGPALAVYGYFANWLNFTQDDSYITYRYVANYLNGDGLVFNIGERVEGITNHGWAILQILVGVLGGDYILFSRVLGLLCGAGTIIMALVIARLLFKKDDFAFLGIATLLVGCNMSLAYWAPAGLETACFALIANLVVYLFLIRSRWLVLAMMWAVWIRPEGALLCGLLLITEAIVERRIPLYALRHGVLAFILSLPFVMFKLFYYGSIVPNPFHAKTSAHFDQLIQGAEYAGKFFAEYGFYGLGFVLCAVFFEKLSPRARSLVIISTLYVAYIVIVGGDVLQVHRFFLPLMGPSAIVLALGLWAAFSWASAPTRMLVAVIAIVPAIYLTVALPRKNVETYNTLEKVFTRKMDFMASRLLESDSRNFSLAVSTIGMIGYRLVGHTVIDVVGLTDSTIARYSEDPIPGMTSTWKERKHNTKYILSRAPDYIMFSTGMKPSAPAERALHLYPQFLNCYRSVGWYFNPEGRPQGVVSQVLKRVRPIEGDIVPTYPVEYVEHYKKGLDFFVQLKDREAIREYDIALAASPQPYFVYLLYQKAFSYFRLGELAPAKEILEPLVARDSLVFEAHRDLYLLARVDGNEEKAKTHERWLKELVPWYWDRIKSTADKAVGDRDAARKAGQIAPAEEQSP
jgi:arabinofuranosyltransferase